MTKLLTRIVFKQRALRAGHMWAKANHAEVYLTAEVAQFCWEIFISIIFHNYVCLLYVSITLGICCGHCWFFFFRFFSVFFHRVHKEQLIYCTYLKILYKGNFLVDSMFK